MARVGEPWKPLRRVEGHGPWGRGTMREKAIQNVAAEQSQFHFAARSPVHRVEPVRAEAVNQISQSLSPQIAARFVRNRSRTSQYPDRQISKNSPFTNVSAQTPMHTTIRRIDSPFGCQIVKNSSFISVWTPISNRPNVLHFDAGVSCNHLPKNSTFTNVLGTISNTCNNYQLASPPPRLCHS
jgi:hypothetical protein